MPACPMESVFVFFIQLGLNPSKQVGETDLAGVKPDFVFHLTVGLGTISQGRENDKRGNEAQKLDFYEAIKLLSRKY